MSRRRKEECWPGGGVMPPRSCPSSARDRSVEVVVTLPASRTRALVLAGWVGGKERRLPALPAAREVVRALLARPLRPSHAASHPGVTATLQGARLRRVVGCAGPAGPRTPRRGLVQKSGVTATLQLADPASAARPLLSMLSGVASASRPSLTPRGYGDPPGEPERSSRSAKERPGGARPRK